MWPGRRFGMVLHTESREFAMPNPRNGLVVEIAVGDLQAVGQRLFLDGKAVILCRYFDLATFKMEYRLVGAAMTELHFESLCPAG